MDSNIQRWRGSLEEKILHAITPNHHAHAQKHLEKLIKQIIVDALILSGNNEFLEHYSKRMSDDCTVGLKEMLSNHDTEQMVMYVDDRIDQIKSEKVLQRQIITAIKSGLRALQKS